ncbi:MAG: methyltransferase domain-containing protein [Ilumatobacteraceae bacterium]|nr:methyltransferase domain-containing protein [Ilumatobacteraceae bacterium]
MPDAAFSDPRLAAIFDDLDGERNDLDGERNDLDLYAELGARSVVDVGCGTGSLACRLAALDVDVVGVDPAEASLDVARRKPAASGVEWIHGDAESLIGRHADLAVMTGNVAQVFLDDDQWSRTLRALRSVVRVDGVFAFETRDPHAQAWRGWNREQTDGVVATAAGPVERWVEVTALELPLVSFRWTYRFANDTEVVSDSTLRFRSRDELSTSLAASGWSIDDVRDAPDRPGRFRSATCEPGTGARRTCPITPVRSPTWSCTHRGSESP